MTDDSISLDIPLQIEDKPVTGTVRQDADDTLRQNGYNTTENGLICPTVHLNGTSRESLMDQYRAAYRAVQDALKALANASPHGRDYYVQEDGAYNRAAREHNERCEKLRIVSDELLEIALAIQDQ